MNIGIFSTQIGTRGTGPEILDRNVVATLPRVDSENRYTVYCVNEVGSRSIELNGPNINVKTIRPEGKWAAVSFGVSRELLRHPVDLLHATFVSPLYTPCPSVFSLTCFSQYDHPEFYPADIRMRVSFLTSWSIRHAAGVVCLSNFLKQKLMERFNYPGERIFISYPGVSKECRIIEDRELLRQRLKQFGIQQPYILFVGSLTDRKNPFRLIRAYAQVVAQQRIPHRLVLMGDRAWVGDRLDRLVGELKIEDRVIVVPSRSHDDLPWIYNGADLFAFPTLYEGFGLPPLEAMACGTPVIASNLTSVPEVCGNAALYFDPYSVEELATSINRVLSDSVVRQDLVSKGLQRAREFTWEGTTEAMLKAYSVTMSNVDRNRSS